MALLLVALLGVGLAVGLLSGLVGIGGGVLIVPFLYFFYQHPDWSRTALDPALHAAVAHATSLFIIFPTAVRGALTYHHAGLVVWRTAFPVAAGSAIAAIFGARLALVLPAEALKLAFGVFLVGSGLQLLFRKTPESRAPIRDATVLALLTGAAVGLFSALLGVGGGLVAIPLLLYVVRLDVKQVAATSLAVIAFATTTGIATYMASGWGEPGLPPGSLGYVHAVVAAPILVGSLITVRWGAQLNQRLDGRRLQKVFSVLFLLLGVRLVLENGLALLG